MTRTDIPPMDALTPREQEIVELVAAGLTNAEIADILHISFPTVRNHVSSILSKLGASTREEAAERWCREGDRPGIAAGWKRWVQALVPSLGFGGALKVAAGGAAVLLGGTAIVAAVAMAASVADDDSQVVAAPEPTATATPTPTPFPTPTPDPAMLAAREAGQYEELVLTRNVVPEISPEEYRARMEALANCYSEDRYTVFGPVAHSPDRISLTTFTDQAPVQGSEAPLCLQKPEAIWEDVLFMSFRVVSESEQDELITDTGGAALLSLITPYQLDLLADGRITLEEHRRAAAKTFACIHDEGGQVDTSQFEPSTHHPSFSFPAGTRCVDRYYQAVSTVWQTIEDPQRAANFILEFHADDGAATVRAILISDDGAPIEHGDAFAGCVAASSIASVVRESPDDRIVVDVVVDDANALSQQLATCEDGTTGSMVVLQFARFLLVDDAATPPDVPPSPFILSTGFPYSRALEDGAITPDELRQTRLMYLGCLDRHGWEVSREDPMDADIESLYSVPEGADMAALEDWRRACEIEWYGGIEEVWALQPDVS